MKVKSIFFLKIYPRLSTTNIRKYRDCLMNVGSCPTLLLDPEEKSFSPKMNKYLRFYSPFFLEVSFLRAASKLKLL